MHGSYGIETPARSSGDVGPGIDVWAWILAFALLLAAPCVPEPPRAAAPGGAAPAADVSAPPADAPPPP